jgi:hypothetical protein
VLFECHVVTDDTGAAHAKLQNIGKEHLVLLIVSLVQVRGDTIEPLQLFLTDRLQCAVPPIDWVPKNRKTFLTRSASAMTAFKSILEFQTMGGSCR